MMLVLIYCTSNDHFLSFIKICSEVQVRSSIIVVLSQFLVTYMNVLDLRRVFYGLVHVSFLQSPVSHKNVTFLLLLCLDRGLCSRQSCCWSALNK